MAYEMQIEQIDPPMMRRITQFYNNAPHNGLSKILGFTITPTDAERDIRLQKEVIRRTIAMNHYVRKTKGYMLSVGTEVHVYNSPDAMNKRRASIKPSIYTIIGFNGSAFQLRNNDNGEVEWSSRSKIKPVERLRQ
jgi:hypothetical protein